MIKLIVGVKGTGKTKQLISLANEAGEKSNGCVVCIEKGTKLIHEIKYKVRLVNAEEYLVLDAEALYGFIAGVVASNSDVTDIFVDSALKICENNMADFVAFVAKLDKFVEKHPTNIVMTSSIPTEEVPDSLRPYIG